MTHVMNDNVVQLNGGCVRVHDYVFSVFCTDTNVRSLFLKSLEAIDKETVETMWNNIHKKPTHRFTFRAGWERPVFVRAERENFSNEV